MDLHKETAAIMFGVSRCQVTPEQREAAKIHNYGWAYGTPGQMPLPRNCMCGASVQYDGTLPCGH